jgi:hypothetical protein
MIVLPAALRYSGYQTFIGRFAETNAAQSEFSHETMLAPAFKTAADNPAFEFWRSLCFGDQCFGSHVI